MATQGAGLDVRVLGIPRVFWGGQALKLPSQKALAIVAYVVVRQRPATRGELAELLWPVGAAANLRPELHRLRGLAGADAWLDVGTNVAIAATTDLAELESAVHEERFGAALALHSASEELLRGLAPRHALAFADWLDHERRRVQDLVQTALRGHARDLEGREAHAEALACLREVLEHDPLDEAAHRAVMRCEVRRGHVDAALAQFEVCRRVLAHELGAEPSHETTELARSIEGGALPVAGAAAGRMPPALLRPPVLVGRARAWARLEAAWDAGQIINVSGAAGVGKTRLVMDFVRSKGSVFVLEGRVGDEVVPYASLARALRSAIGAFPSLLDGAPRWVLSEVARILPDVVPDAPTASTQDHDAARFFEAQIYLMGRLRHEVAAIVVDDLQDLDARSFEVGLGAQARLQGGAGDASDARMLAVFRPGELPAAFEQGLELAVRHGIAVHVELQPLDADALRALLESLGVADADASAPGLLQLTGGNPQLVIETLKQLHEVAGSLDAIAGEVGAADTVASVFEQRLDRLGPFALRVVRALAVLDGPTDAAVLARVLDARPADVAGALAELERVQMLHDGSFVHHLLRESVQARTPGAQRMALHGRLAEVLADAGGDPRRVAHHRRRAVEHGSADALRSVGETRARSGAEDAEPAAR